jgi:hypothetical protein
MRGGGEIKKEQVWAEKKAEKLVTVVIHGGIKQKMDADHGGGEIRKIRS